MINQDFNHEGWPIIPGSEPSVLAAVEKIDRHSHEAEKRPGGRETLEIGEAGSTALEENDFEQLWQQRSGNHVGHKGKGIKIAILDSGLGEDYINKSKGKDEVRMQPMNIVCIKDFTKP